MQEGVARSQGACGRAPHQQRRALRLQLRHTCRPAPSPPPPPIHPRRPTDITLVAPPPPPPHFRLAPPASPMQTRTSILAGPPPPHHPRSPAKPSTHAFHTYKLFHNQADKKVKGTRSCPPPPPRLSSTRLGVRECSGGCTSAGEPKAAAD